jgi:hypothetical protein
MDKEPARDETARTVREVNDAAFHYPGAKPKAPGDTTPPTLADLAFVYPDEDNDR